MNYKKMHQDMLNLFLKMENEDAGEMIKAIASNSDESLPKHLKLVFEVFKNQFNRDEEAYNSIVKRNQANGRKGGRPKTQNNPENPVGFLGTQKSQEEEEEEEKEKEKKEENIYKVPRADFPLVENPSMENPSMENQQIIKERKTIKKDLIKKEEKKENIYKEIFEKFRSIYPGSKLGLGTEFENFKKKHSDWKEVLPQLEEKISAQIEWRKVLKLAGEFVPYWKNLGTWINNRCWEEEGMQIEANYEAELEKIGSYRFIEKYGRAKYGELFSKQCHQI